ncbi:BLOC-1 related complex subunit 6 [Dunckerocampus dactyliophorus]|uniref:BLOC-1 related complex subunit 6 n=1 Tax=Dunckerocampus dactyliophorus TaxID=161453 RepID=UPI002405C7E9|nr:BLOC-1 related complex subunit 6 [Dunckerocampus dactyliophorus]XP_054637350.1 BLOC-1 related complex subunit 6 [Dunckerocampus dactyliophorus]
MSLSPVVGTEVPETANGIATLPCSENGPHVPVVKCVGGKEDFPREDTYLRHTENRLGGEKTVQDCHFLDTEMEDNVRTSSLSLYPSHEMALSTSEDSCTADYSVGVRPGDSSRPAGLQQDLPSNHSLYRSGRPVTTDFDSGEEEEKEKQDKEEDEKMWRTEVAGERKEVESLRHYSSSAPGPSTSTSSSSPPPPLLPSDDAPCPPHVMAQVWVRNVRGMQDSKSLDEISQACGGGAGARGAGKGGQSEGRRATISSALELEGTVSHDGDLTNFITKNLEQKIKMSSKPSLDCSDSDCSGPIYHSRGLSRRPADIPPIDPTVLVDLQRHTQEVAHSVEMMMRSLNGTIQNMTALSVGYIQTYRDSVDSLGESVDMSIKGMYTLMARCEELDRSMQPINVLAAQIRDIKRTLDALEAICK